MIRNCTCRALRAMFPAALALLASPAFAADDAAAVAPTPIHQLRVYEIHDAAREAFHDRFRDHAARIMARYDFDIVAIWESRDDGRLEFVYLLQWPDQATMKDRWARFMADAEWAEIKRETGRVHGRFVGTIKERTLLPVAYSPTKAFPERAVDAPVAGAGTGKQRPPS